MDTVSFIGEWKNLNDLNKDEKEQMTSGTHGQTTEAGENNVSLPSNKNVIVVSRYSEDPFWVLSDPDFESFGKVIYNKGNALQLTPENPAGCYSGPVTIKNLPNVGREGHTYLHHIVENYDNLAPVTVFIPASAYYNDLRNFRVHEIVHRVIETNDTVFLCRTLDRDVQEYFADFEISTWIGSNKDNANSAQSKTDPSQIARPFAKWYAHFFPGVNIREISFNGIFAVSRKHIQQHARAYYIALRDALTHSSNPEDGHFLERSWIAVFHPLPNKCLIPYEYSDITVPEQWKWVLVFSDDKKNRLVYWLEYFAWCMKTLIIFRILAIILVVPLYYVLRWFYAKYIMVLPIGLL